MQLAGELATVSLPSLIQHIRSGELTGKICFTQGANTAFMFVDGGRIVHVETDTAAGRNAFLELFLWATGTFSFIETSIADTPHSLSTDEPLEQIVAEGLTYLEQKKFLDRLRINLRTILRATAPGVPSRDPVLAQFDGKKCLGDVLAQSQLSKRIFIESVYNIISRGQAVIVEPPQSVDSSVKLPAWVTARLQQDNADVAQAIVDMVIWVDRVKCWLYQADADLEQVVGHLSDLSLSSVGGGEMATNLTQGSQADDVELTTSALPDVEF